MVDYYNLILVDRQIMIIVQSGIFIYSITFLLELISKYPRDRHCEPRSGEAISVKLELY